MPSRTGRARISIDDARKFIDCTLEMLEDSNVNHDNVQPIQ